jgi:hypothetical protein
LPEPPRAEVEIAAPKVASAHLEEDPPKSDPQAEPAVEIKIRSNAPLVAMRVSGHSVKVTPGAGVVVVTVASQQAAQLLHVEATASDGRHASLTLPGRATEGRLVFPPVEPAPKDAKRRASSPFVLTSPYDK